MQEEVTQKTIALSMKTGKLTAQVLQMALKKYLEARKHGPKLHHGQQSLKQLKQHGAALSNIEITDANIAAFKPCAKKYGVDFTLRKDKTTQPPHYIVIFKSRDADNRGRPSPPSVRRCPSCGKRLAGMSSGPRRKSGKGGWNGEAGCKENHHHEFALSAVCVAVRQDG